MGLRWHLRASAALERQEFRWRAEGLASQTGMLGAAWSAVGLSAVDWVPQTGCALALPGLCLLMLALCVGLGEVFDLHFEHAVSHCAARLHPARALPCSRGFGCGFLLTPGLCILWQSAGPGRRPPPFPVSCAPGGPGDSGLDWASAGGERKGRSLRGFLCQDAPQAPFARASVPFNNALKKSASF